MGIIYKQRRIPIHPAVFNQKTFQETMLQLGAAQLTSNKYFLTKRLGNTTIFLGSLDEGDRYIYVQGGLRKKDIVKKICIGIYPVPRIKLIR